MYPFIGFYFKLFCLVLLIDIIKGADYYYGFPKPGDKEFSCDHHLVKSLCSRICGEKYTCMSGQCHCDNSSQSTTSTLADVLKDFKKYVSSHYFNNRKPEKKKTFDIKFTTDNGFVDSTLRQERPALRHHIAHFCPDLEQARQCIRGCMKLGKPAFCGKDHICYCGHKYENTQHDKPLNVDDMYAEFRDLYEKYFGANDEEMN